MSRFAEWGVGLIWRLNYFENKHSVRVLVFSNLALYAEVLHRPRPNDHGSQPPNNEEIM